MRCRKILVLCIMGVALCSLWNLHALADEPEVYVVAADSRGYNNYMVCNGDGTFSDQVFMGRTTLGQYTYGNGIGDFDNDGDLDYIVATGCSNYPKEIYLYEKLGPGKDFAPPLMVATWTESNYAMDMAVADYNGDGNLDFVLTHRMSTHCELYLGDGSFGFNRSVLTDTAPYYSMGADAADFNHDGHADFVVAPYYGGDGFFLNLGNGDGTFDTFTVSNPSDMGYWGVAAADFDEDGEVDLVGIRYAIMDFHRGRGDGSFDLACRVDDRAMGWSPVDNYDFNDDGHQDLVIGQYDGYANVGVFLGNGDGTFTCSAVHGGGSGSSRNAIAAPPDEQNVPPVARVAPFFQEITAGEIACFDGSGSEDLDGDIVAYAWDFGDGTETASAVSASSSYTSYVYRRVGRYTVTLTVTDDRGAVGRAAAEVDVTALPATVELSPKTLNLKSQGNWVNATIVLPDGYEASQVDLGSVALQTDTSGFVLAVNDPKYGFVAHVEKHGGDGCALKVKFDRTAVEEAVAGASDEVMIHIVGSVNQEGYATDFSGSDTIRIIRSGKTK